MPKLADLLSVDVNNSSGMGAEWLVNFAYLLGMELQKAQTLYESNGKGCIYTRTGFVMPDTPYMRRKLVANFGACVIVGNDGSTWVRTKDKIGERNRKRAEIDDKVKRRKIRRAESELCERKRLDRLFKDGQTQPQPKRGGKANSHADIGKYVNHRGFRIDIVEPRGVTKFQKIVINI